MPGGADNPFALANNDTRSATLLETFLRSSDGRSREEVRRSISLEPSTDVLRQALNKLRTSEDSARKSADGVKSSRSIFGSRGSSRSNSSKEKAQSNPNSFRSKSKSTDKTPEGSGGRRSGGSLGNGFAAMKRVLLGSGLRRDDASDPSLKPGGRRQRKPAEMLAADDDSPTSSRGSAEYRVTSRTTSNLSSRRVSLDDRNVGIVGPDGQLQRCRGFPMDWKPWELDLDHLEFCFGADGREVELGRGAFGQVVLANLNGVVPVAVKQLKVEQTTAVREAAMLKALCNPNIVQFQGACLREDDTLLLVTEFMEGGDLYRAIHNKKIVTWHRRGASIALDVARGLHFLHSNKVAHLDIKPGNILLTRHGVAKLADVGLARINVHSRPNSQDCRSRPNSQDCPDSPSAGITGTLTYAAPEQLIGTTTSTKADIFSMGVVLWEIATGEIPVRGRMRPVRVPEECPEEVADLIDRCMEIEPAARPTAREVFDTLRVMEQRQRMGNGAGSGPGSGPSRRSIGSRLAAMPWAQELPSAENSMSHLSVGHRPPLHATEAAAQAKAAPGNGRIIRDGFAMAGPRSGGQLKDGQPLSGGGARGPAAGRGASKPSHATAIGDSFANAAPRSAGSSGSHAAASPAGSQAGDGLPAIDETSPAGSFNTASVWSGASPCDSGPSTRSTAEEAPPGLHAFMAMASTVHSRPNSTDQPQVGGAPEKSGTNTGAAPANGFASGAAHGLSGQAVHDTFATAAPCTRPVSSDSFANAPACSRPGSGDSFASAPARMQPAANDSFAPAPARSRPGSGDSFAKASARTHPAADASASGKHHGMQNGFAMAQPRSRPALGDAFANAAPRSSAEAAVHQSIQNGFAMAGARARPGSNDGFAVAPPRSSAEQPGPKGPGGTRSRTNSGDFVRTLADQQPRAMQDAFARLSPRMLETA